MQTLIVTYPSRYLLFTLDFPLSPCVQGHSADDVVLKLLDLVLGTLKPLVSQSPDSSTGSSGGGNLLSPASEQTTGLLLALALEIGVTVSCNYVYSCIAFGVNVGCWWLSGESAGL